MGAVRLEVTSRPLAGGRDFGEVGAYTEVTGEVHFAVDPLHPMNAGVTDLELAPRDGEGRVTFSADMRMFRPVDGRRGNRAIFLEVPNRGGSIFERMTEPGAMGPNTRLSAGWLLQRGYTLVSCGWQHDVARGNGRFGLTAPHALIDGKPVTGTVTSAKQMDVAATVMGPFDGSAPEFGYPALDVNEQAARLTVSDAPSQPGQLIPRDQWQFVDPAHVSLPAGFQAGKTYELSYTAIGAPVTGIGFVALRDLLSYLRFSPDWAGQFDTALAMGASQTGRFLRQMVYSGFCEDDQGRLVLDGVLAIAAGARVTEANWRFGQPSAYGPTSARFPFTDITQTDPHTGRTDGLLKRAQERGKIPRVMHLNTSSEYVSGAAIPHISAALTHLRADGHADAEVPAEVRIYHCAGTQHASSPLPLGPSEVPTGRAAYHPNTIDYKPFVRAAIDNLHAWVTRGVEPPPSCYPRLDNATLVDREVVRQRLPHLPGPGLPERAVLPDRLPAIDADGNEVAGIRHPDLSVPLATYTGWNPRHPDAGSTHLLARSTGATIPFPRNMAERMAGDDPRASIEERYASRDAYLGQIRAAAVALVEQAYLLAADVDGIVDASAARYDEFTRVP